MLQHWAWVAVGIISHLRPRVWSLRNMHLQERHPLGGSRACLGSPGGQALTSVTAREPRSCTSAHLWRMWCHYALGQSEGRAGRRAQEGAEWAAALRLRLRLRRKHEPGKGWWWTLLWRLLYPEPSSVWGLGEVLVHRLFLTAAAKMSAEDQVAFMVFSL